MVFAECLDNGADMVSHRKDRRHSQKQPHRPQKEPITRQFATLKDIWPEQEKKESRPSTPPTPPSQEKKPKQSTPATLAKQEKELQQVTRLVPPAEEKKTPQSIPVAPPQESQQNRFPSHDMDRRGTTTQIASMTHKAQTIALKEIARIVSTQNLRNLEIDSVSADSDLAGKELSQKRRDRYTDRMTRNLSKSESIGRERLIPIILGIDMGTSTTKVVWREVDNERAYPLCFGAQQNRLEHYLLPTIVAFDGSHFAGGSDVDGLLRNNHRAEIFSNFKMCLACVSSEKTDCNLERCPLSHWRPLLARSRNEETLGSGEAIETVGALHLGKVISSSRKLIEENLRSRGVIAQIPWTANMAAPVEHMGEKSVLGAFERVLKVGWLMADIFDESPGPRELEDLLDCYQSARELASRRALDCFVYPEVAAEMASMYLSRSARDGLYAFVDVGGGTVDASIFRLYSADEGLRLSFYGAVVLKAGAAHLESIASRQLAERSMNWFRSIKEGGSSLDEPSFFQPEEATHFLETASVWIGSRVEKELRRLLKSAFGKEQDSTRWRDLHLLFGGGGAELQVYSNASKSAFGGVATNLALEKLPVPQDFQMNGMPPHVFHRFAVAYGLSFNVVNLPDIGLPDQLSELSYEDLHPAKATPEMPSKDVC